MDYWLQRLSIIAVAAAGIVLSPFICLFMMQGDYIWFAACVGGLLLILFLSQDVRKQWIYIICSTAVAGALNFLPVNFTFFEIMVILVSLHFFLAEVIFKKRGLGVGDGWMLTGIAIVGLVVLYHWFKGGIGLKVLGGDSVGARKSLSMVLGVISYFLVVTLCRGQWKILNWLPAIYFCVASVMSIPFLVSTFAPSLAPYIYAFYGDVNTDAYSQVVLGEESVGRIGKYASIATAMELALLAYYPVKDWWRPDRWFVLILWLVGLWLCMYSGYRNSMFNYVIAFVFGSFASSKFKSVFLWVFAVVVVFVMALGHGTLFELPAKAQRAISFMPGKWDAAVLSDTSASNDFRAQIQAIYLEEYVYKSPWIGGGFNYDAREVKGIESFKTWDENPYEMFKGFIIRKDYHVGWISLYDPLGIVGAIGFFILFFAGTRYLILMLRMGWDHKTFPIVVWLMASWIPAFLSFFAVFGAIQSMFPQMCMYAALIWCTYQTMKEEEAEKTSEKIREIDSVPSQGMLSNLR